jgi:predicted RNase H-like HicB family nuclease
MEFNIRVHVEKLPEGVYLATSDDVQGLVAQGRTIGETLEIARDVARQLPEAQRERSQEIHLPMGQESSEYTIVVGG